MDNGFTPNVTDDTLKQTKRHFSKLGLMFLLGTVIIYGVQIAASAIAGAVNPDLLESTAYSLLITMIPMYVIAMPLMALLIHTVPAISLEKKKMTAGQWILAFLMCYGGMYVSNYIGVIITQLIGVMKGSPVSNTILEIATSSNVWVNFFIMVICAPISEELLFRKMIIDRTAKYGEATAVLFSGLMFGLFHGNLNQFVYAFVLGLFFGFIYVKTGNVLYTIFMHMLVNFLGSIVGVLLVNWLGDDFMNALNNPADIMTYAMSNMSKIMVYFGYAILMLGVAITGIILIIVNAKKIRFQPGEVTIPKGKRFTTTIVNIGMGIYFLFWIVMIILQLIL